MGSYEVRGEDGEYRNVVDDFARSSFPELYTGFSIDGFTATVHRVPTPGLPLDAALRARFPDLGLRFADTPRNRVELDAVVERVLADLDDWRARGIDIIMFGPGIVDGVIEIGIRQTDESAIEAVQAHYGDIAVVKGGVRPGTFLPLRVSDLADSAAPRGRGGGLNRPRGG